VFVRYGRCSVRGRGLEHACEIGSAEGRGEPCWGSSPAARAASEPPDGYRTSTSGLSWGTPTLAVDVSKWSGPVTDAELDCLWDEGVRHLIAGTQNPRITRQQLDAAIGAGMTVDAYDYLYWNGDVAGQVHDAVALASEYPVGYLWLDIEEPAEGRSPVELEALIREALDACGSHLCGIYTGRWWWDANMAGSTVASEVPLWYAYYDDVPSLETWEAHRFGGWDEPFGGPSATG